MHKLFYFIMLLSLSLFSCTNSAQKTEISVNYFITAYNKDNQKILTQPFGTFITLIGYNQKKVDSLKSIFNDEMIRMHQLFDNNYYYKDIDGNIINNLKVINDSYGSESELIVDEDLFNILKEGIRFSNLSNGKFNIAVGSLVSLWDERFDTSSLLYGIDPTIDEVNDALSCVPSISELNNILILNETNKSVRFFELERCTGKVSLTLGAFGKSYAINKISQRSEFSEGPFLINGGQSSIGAIGKKIDNQNWKILVPVSSMSKNNPNANLFQISKLGSFTLSTSSGDEKGYINEQGIRRHHIIDATTGYPSTQYYSVTVTSNNAYYDDIVTTSIMTMTKQETLSFLKKLENEGIKFGVLLQIDDQGSLKVEANEEMLKLSGDSYQIEVKVFNYDA